MEIASSALGHEIVHTSKENIIIFENKGKGAAEIEPTKISDKIIDQVNEKKKK
jgi:hypothetical protein